MPGTRHDELLGPVEDALLEAGYELVALKLIPRGGSLSVQVLIDHRDGSAAVTLGDCARASRAIHERADLDRRLPGRYVLEVSSPGVDRPLTRPAHYQRFQGERVVVRLAAPRPGGGSLRGTIRGADADSVTLELEGGGSERLRLEDIASAHLQVDPWKGRVT
jgi:ribosome maturation factor RimP